MNKKRFSIRFDLDEETDREAWEYLDTVPNGSRKTTVLAALLRDKHDRYKKDELKQLIKSTIKEALAGSTTCPSPVPAASETPDGIPSDVLEFMKGL